MDDYSYWPALQYADECQRQRQIIDALDAAREAGTPPDVIDLLAMECGVRDLYHHKGKRQ